MEKKINKKKIILLILTILVCLSIFSINSKKYNQQNYLPPAINGDSHQYLAMSLQIFNNKTITHDHPNVIGWPSNYREFVYPLYISFFYNFLDSDHDYSECVLEKQIKECVNFYKVISIAQVLLLFATLITCLMFLHKRPIYYILSSLIILYVFYHKEMIFYFGPEHLSALLLFYTSYYLKKLVYSTKYQDLLICSFFFVTLIFIKNIFHYLSFLILIFSGIIIFTNYIKFKLSFSIINKSKIFTINLFVVSLISLILVMPYQLRNVIHFDDSSLSKRGKEMLTLRNEFLKADYKTLTKGFYYYFPNIFGFKNDRMRKIQGESFFYEQNQKSHYRTYTKENGYMINYFNNKYGTKYSGYGELELYEKKKIMKTNVEIYLKNIVKQSYISCLIFFRGLNENYNIAKKNLFQKFVFDIFYYFFTFYFFYSFFKSLRNKDMSNFIFYIPTIYFIFMMSTLSNTEPRMNNSLILILILNFFINFVGKKKTL